MDMMLKGKRALVTGSSSGIGAAIARTLAREGVRVVVHGRDPSRTRAVADCINRTGGTAAFVIGDLTTEAGVCSTLATANNAFGGIDILVNNAGGASNNYSTDWFDVEMSAWAQSYAFNTLAPVRLIKELIPAMKQRGWGRVIQISSRNAISPHAQFGDYGAAKAAINNITLSLSKALAGSGVTSNGIMPGLIYTPALDEWFVDMAEKHANSSDAQDGAAYVLSRVVQQTVNRLGTPQDIANAVAYIASPLSDFMTGTTIRIDGGSTQTM